MRKLRVQPVALCTLVAIAAVPARAEDLDAPDPTLKPAYGFAWETPYFSVRLGGGILVDYARYAQDDASERQMDLNEESEIRDLRGLASGKLGWSRLSYTIGYMRDIGAHAWRFRQTGLILQVPELSGNLFVGRTKEGFSTNKLMVGYYGWVNERAAVNDAFLPILADGVRWTGTGFGGRLLYNVGAFADALSETESFNKNDWQFVGRGVYRPLAGGDGAPVVHLVLEARYAGADDGMVRYRSKPEAFLAQSQAVDTGDIPASRSTILGAEAYVVAGPFSTGTEYFVNRVRSAAANDPLFHGGEVFAAYLITGETHPYKETAGVFGNVEPARSFFSGGPGAWEAVVRVSYVDLDSETIRGGRFFRVTPVLNWYLNASLRLSAIYGYGRLARDGDVGTTHFLQTRVQLAF